MSLNVCIFGVSGYTGSKLLYYLNKHKKITVVGVFGNSKIGESLSQMHPDIKNLPELKITNYYDFDFSKVDLIFSCLPAGLFQSKIIENLDPNIPIIDLSGDFRLENKRTYEKFYEMSHKNFHLIDKFVYGLTEINRDVIKKSKFISNPGCYPTSILIPLIPLLKHDVIKSGHIIIDSKSGMSGAGKKSVENRLLAELKNNFYSYCVTSHKHFPEIDQEIKKVNKNISFTFVPNLLPIFSGLQSNIYIDHTDLKLKEIREVIHNFYKGESFIKIKDEKPVKLSQVQGTNNVFINIFEDFEKKKILIISCIDNLIKGAAGQAIQNMNLMFGFKESESLI
jgi:N-acetyl-gamma-glutamyl-phosphate reductase